MIKIGEVKKCEECGRTNKDWRIIDSKKFKKLLCEKCYSKYTRKYNGSDEFRVCEYCGITSNETRIIKSKKYNKTLCERHHQLYSKEGKLRRTMKDPNKIIIKDDYALIELYNKNLDVIGYSKIDKEDIDKVKNIKWGVNRKENKKYVGKTVEVLVEGESKNNPETFMGRSRRNKLIIFPREKGIKGKIVDVKINKVKSWTLYGEIVNKR